MMHCMSINGYKLVSSFLEVNKGTAYKLSFRFIQTFF